ncbi:unnamed protein product [Ambrosiozyma monospora]|uniref:Unnamed protein product n=1 Tax=Ambrosiozyma monospora TaxID=43982 RepID=A0ACB5SXH2_AMBMO|nr:unnamed protein product [Ambrosiozyma monospora]
MDFGRAELKVKTEDNYTLTPIFSPSKLPILSLIKGYCYKQLPNKSVPPILAALVRLIENENGIDDPDGNDTETENETGNGGDADDTTTSHTSRVSQMSDVVFDGDNENHLNDSVNSSGIDGDSDEDEDGPVSLSLCFISLKKILMLLENEIRSFASQNTVLSRTTTTDSGDDDASSICVEGTMGRM